MLCVHLSWDYKEVIRECVAKQLCRKVSAEGFCCWIFCDSCFIVEYSMKLASGNSIATRNAVRILTLLLLLLPRAPTLPCRQPLLSTYSQFKWEMCGETAKRRGFINASGWWHSLISKICHETPWYDVFSRALLEINTPMKQVVPQAHPTA